MVAIDTYYLVDYENVHHEGLVGINNLGKTDHVIIFFTRNSTKMDMRKISGLNSVDFRTIEVPAGKQSADMHIGSYLGYLIGMNTNKKINVVIISKDKDYDNLITFWKDNARVSKREKIDLPKDIVKSISNPKNENNTKKDLKGNQKSTRKSTQTSIKNLNQLIEEITNVLKKKKYLSNVIDMIVEIAEKTYGKENFQKAFYEALITKFDKGDEIFKDLESIFIKNS